MRRAFVSLCAVLALSGGAAAAEARPNLVVILSDDMGFSDIGCYGGEIATPNLDAPRFRRAALHPVLQRRSLLPHAGQPAHRPLCAPDWRRPHDGGSRTALPRLPRRPQPLLPHHRRDAQAGRLPRIRCRQVARHQARRQGRTQAQLAAEPRLRPLLRHHPRGRQLLRSLVAGARRHDDLAYADPEYKPATYYYTDAISDHAVRFVGDHAKQHKDKPFFLYVAYTAAHWPMHALPADLAKHKGKYDAGYGPIRKARLLKAAKLGLIDARQGLSPQAGDWAKVKDRRWEAACMETYAAMVDRMDQGDRQARRGTEADGPAGQHPHPVPPGQRRLRRADGPHRKQASPEHRAAGQADLSAP